MTSYHRCSKCSSPDMVDGAYVADAQGIRIVIGVDSHPDRGKLLEAASTRIHAALCGSCGFVELYANKPRELLDVYLQAATTSRPTHVGGR